MKTCVVVAAQQRTRYGTSTNTGSRGQSHAHSASSCFREISCRSFQSGAGIGLLPTPLKNTCTSSSNINSSTSAPPPTSPKGTPIPIKTRGAGGGCTNGLCFRQISYSELWAGPAYSNSPPPSSVPIPKFSTRSKPTRTVSLELPVMAKEVLPIRPLAKSAPSSPRESYLFDTADNATEALRRILNLDICDE